MFRHHNVQAVLRTRTGYTLVRWILLMALSAGAMSWIQPWLDNATVEKLFGIFMLLVYAGITLFFELFPQQVQDWLERNATRTPLPSELPAPAEYRPRPEARIIGSADAVSRHHYPTTMLLLLANVMALLFVFEGGVGLRDELRLHHDGIQVGGTVTRFVSAEDAVSADITLSPAGQLPAQVHLGHASARHPWAVGLKLSMICTPAGGCEINSWHDRWKVPVVTLVIGGALLLWFAPKAWRKLRLARRDTL
jgi:hypothetical protein